MLVDDGRGCGAIHGLVRSACADGHRRQNGGQVVTVPGSRSSPWNVGNSLIMDNAGNGTLESGSSGSVSSPGGYIGRHCQSHHPHPWQKMRERLLAGVAMLADRDHRRFAVAAALS